MYSRRDFLATSILAGLGLATAGGIGSLFAAPPAARAGSGLLTRPIPSTGEALPVIGAGTSGSYDVAVGTPEYAQLQEVLKIFFDGGARVIDTAPNYGKADATLGQLLTDGGWHDRVFLATKIAADSAEAAQAQWAQSLAKLQTDTVDLLFVHNLRDWKRQLAYARELKAQRKTRYVGVTHYIDSGLPELEQVLRSEKLDFIQIHYSVNSTAAARTVLPLAQEKGVAVLINRAFDDGKLFAQVRDRALPGWAAEAGITSWAQLFLKFAISHPAVTTVIPATGKPDRQLDQLKAGIGPLLSQAQQQELVRSFAG